MKIMFNRGEADKKERSKLYCFTIVVVVVVVDVVDT